MRSTAAANNGDSISRTVWILAWAFMTLVWSIFTPPDRTFAARVIIFQPLWAIRMYMKDRAWVQDLTLFLIVHTLYNYSTGAWRIFTPGDFWWLDPNNDVFMMYIKIFSLLGFCGALAGGIVRRGQQLKSKNEHRYPAHQSINEQLLSPLLIPSRTSHSRAFPEKHSFSYSYLFVGIPVGLQGRVSRALSVDSQQRGWFNVRCEDYLMRGHGELGLAEKLKRYLHSQGVTDRDYSFAYLVTAPRFLGYSFNPVSFWYLYDSDVVLRYMILEVNNTFDERRMYLLKVDSASAADDFKSANGYDQPSRTPEAKASYFTQVWDKDFHVSPFNSRKGTYSLRATDPLAAYQEASHVQIDNTIVLRSSKEHAKLVARVWSEGLCREAASISSIDLALFIISWWWVGLITFPRIVWQAQKLFFRRKLHVWYRPEVVDTSIGRDYTDDESFLETIFHDFLEYAVQNIETPFRLVYKPAQSNAQDIVMYSAGFTYEEDHQRTLTLQVISPAFYSRFVHYAHAKEAFDRECLATDEKNRTLMISNPSLLPTLLKALDPAEEHVRQRHDNVLRMFRWKLLTHLRCPPPAASYDSNGSSDAEVTDIRTFRESEMDRFVQRQSKHVSTYCRILIRLFLAQRFTTGIPAVISGFDRILRILILWMTMYACTNTHVGDVLRPSRFGVEEMFKFGGLVLLANGVHIWSFLKG